MLRLIKESQMAPALSLQLETFQAKPGTGKFQTSKTFDLPSHHEEILTAGEWQNGKDNCEKNGEVGK